MSISKLLKNVRFQYFCLKMRALEKWCLTNVAHCICGQILVLTLSLAALVYPHGEKRMIYICIYLVRRYSLEPYPRSMV